MHCVRLVTCGLSLQFIHSMTASTDESSVGAQSDNTGAVVGGVVVALVAMVVIAVTVVMVTYLVLRYKRGGKL